MIQKIKERIRKTWLWEWGGESSKNGYNLVAYCTLLAFAIYAQVRTYDLSQDTANTALALNSVQSELIFQIQLANYNGCVRSIQNQDSVKQYNQRLLDFATQAGVNVQPLYDELTTLFIAPPACVIPVKVVSESGG